MLMPEGGGGEIEEAGSSLLPLISLQPGTSWVSLSSYRRPSEHQQNYTISKKLLALLHRLPHVGGGSGAAGPGRRSRERERKQDKPERDWYWSMGMS